MWIWSLLSISVDDVSLGCKQKVPPGQVIPFSSGVDGVSLGCKQKVTPGQVIPFSEAASIDPDVTVKPRSRYQGVSVCTRLGAVGVGVEMNRVWMPKRLMDVEF